MHDRLVGMQADRVDSDARAPRLVHHLVERQQRRRVLAVRQHDNRPTSHAIVLTDALPELTQGDVDGVVERRTARCLRLADGVLGERPIGREALQHLHAVVEGEDGRAVGWAERRGEAGRGLLHERQLVAHAGARVEQNREIERHVACLEVGDLLTNTVLVDGEVVAGEAREQLLLPVEHGDVQRHHLHAAAEGLRRTRCLRIGGRAFDRSGRVLHDDRDTKDEGESIHVPHARTPER